MAERISNRFASFFQEPKIFGLLSLWVLLFVMRMSVPFLNPFLILCTVILIFSMIYNRVNFKKILKGSIKVFGIYIIYLSVNLFYLVRDIRDIPRLKSELFQVGMSAVFLLAISMFVRSKKDFRVFVQQLLQYLYYSSLLIAALGLIKFFCLSIGYQVPIGITRGYPAGTSLTIDYNFYALALISGLISYFFLKIQFISKVFLKWEDLFLLIVPFAIFLSGSRRGLLVIVLFYLVSVVLYFVKKKQQEKLSWEYVVLFKKSFRSLLFNVLGIYLVFLFLPQIKIELPKKDSFLNHEFRLFTSNIFYRYLLIVDGSVNYENIYDAMWYEAARASRTEGGNEVELSGEELQSFAENKTYAPRIQRWKYTKEYFNEHMTLRQKLIGAGFSYMTFFGLKFQMEIYDYPHNVYLSALLSTGIVGLSILLFLTSLVLFRLWRTRYLMGAFFVMFCISLLYVSTSANIFLSIPYFLFLFILGLHSVKINSTED